MNFEKLNETNCRIGDIQNNDKIPIGGSFYGKLDLAVTADIDSFETFFVTVEKAGWYYGCGDKADIFPSFIISKHNIQPLRTKEKNL